MKQELGWLNKFSINHNRSKNPKTSMPTTGEAAQEPCTLQKDSEPEKTLALKGLAIIIPTHDTHKHKSHLQPEMADVCEMNTIELLTAELIGALDNILQTKKKGLLHNKQKDRTHPKTLGKNWLNVKKSENKIVQKL